MAIVDFDTCTWSDPWVQDLSPIGKLLFTYFWTNNHKNVACIYTISYKTIRDETGLSQKQIEDTLSILYPKVIYDSDNHIVFVVNHIRRQFMRTGNISPKIIQAIRKNILALPKGHQFISVFLNKYSELEIEYPYPIHTLSIPYPNGIDTVQVGVGVQGGGKDVKGGGGGEDKSIRVGIVPDWVDREAWNGFVEMRKKIKKPLTERAKKLLFDKLEKFMQGGSDPNAILDQSTESDWAGVYPLKENSNGTGRSQNARRGGTGRTARELAGEIISRSKNSRQPPDVRSGAKQAPGGTGVGGVETEVDAKIIDGATVEAE